MEGDGCYVGGPHARKTDSANLLTTDEILIGIKQNQLIDT